MTKEIWIIAGRDVLTALRSVFDALLITGRILYGIVREKLNK